MSATSVCPNAECGAEVEGGRPGAVVLCPRCERPFMLGEPTVCAWATEADEPRPPADPESVGRHIGSSASSARGAWEPSTSPATTGSNALRGAARRSPQRHAGARPRVARALRREARAAAAFRHPNFCPIYEAGEADCRPYLAMAYIEGPTLSQVLAAGGPVEPARAVATVRTLALAMGEAHRRGILHRDLKPSTILVEPTGNLIITDFGLARRLGSGDSSLTQTGEVFGTPAYMAPEQIDGDLAAPGPATDIYALGVILYQMLTGRLPFEGPPGRVMGLVLLSAPPAPSVYRPGLDPAAQAVCLRAMARAPGDRYPSMDAFATDLGRLLDRPGSAPGRATSRRTRLALTALAAGATGTVVAVLVAFGLAASPSRTGGSAVASPRLRPPLGPAATGRVVVTPVDRATGPSSKPAAPVDVAVLAGPPRTEFLAPPAPAPPRPTPPTPRGSQSEAPPTNPPPPTPEATKVPPAQPTPRPGQRHPAAGPEAIRPSLAGPRESSTAYRLACDVDLETTPSSAPEVSIGFDSSGRFDPGQRVKTTTSTSTRVVYEYHLVRGGDRVEVAVDRYVRTIKLR